MVNLLGRKSLRDMRGFGHRLTLLFNFSSLLENKFSFLLEANTPLSFSQYLLGHLNWYDFLNFALLTWILRLEKKLYVALLFTYSKGADSHGVYGGSRRQRAVLGPQ